MNICAIVCEYNPFHNGHMHQIQRVRELLGDDTAIVCIMSGNFVQRGEPAQKDKFARAKCAVLGGASLVIELPVVYSVSSAEHFAFAAVSIAQTLGCVTHIAFGCEHDDLSSLGEIADILLEKSTIDATLLQMKSGISYAAARERALFELIHDKSDIIKSPNNILAIEYIKALKRLGSSVLPIAIKREGAGHDTCTIKDGITSATYIRQLIISGRREEIFSLLPAPTCDMYSTGDIYGTDFSGNVIMSQLVRLSASDFSNIFDVSEGLEHRLHRAVSNADSFDAACELARSRRYPHARIRRILIRAFLGITHDYLGHSVPYIRVLALDRSGASVLALARKSASLPIITKPAHIHVQDDYAKRLFEREALATRLFYMLGKDGTDVIQSDYTYTPYCSF